MAINQPSSPMQMKMRDCSIFALSRAAKTEPACSTDQDPNSAELRVLGAGVTGSGFIHHIIGGLQRGLARGLVIETENIFIIPFQPLRPREYCGSKTDRPTRAAGLKYYCLAGAYVAGGCGEHSLSQAPQPNLEISMGHRGLGSVAQHQKGVAVPGPESRHLSTVPTTKRVPSSSPTPPGSVTLAAAFALFVSLIGYPGILLNNRPFLAVYTAFGLLVIPGYLTYKRPTLNLEAKVNQQWSQELGAAGRLTIQSVLGCCGYFSPFVEATVSATCYSRSIAGVQAAVFGVSGEGIDAVVYSIMAAGLLCYNHVTYRFGKGMMPKAYRPSREAMAVIMQQYASGRVDGVGAGGGADRVPAERGAVEWSPVRRCQLADQYGADAAAHIIANNSGNTGPRAQTHTRGSGLSGLGSGSGGGGGSGGYSVSLGSGRSGFGSDAGPWVETRVCPIQSLPRCL
ncbi:hypothetical protein B0H16DRAFT_1696392 [Mycena metata]|uniref:Uncharacterized protein n=1 Tax=Mycena metata TaxID=1033252 RepID=A0AAD7I1L4_9AGAR|nr:hypothetical protein B0H16DRAFT_1696392 [Mycena metata]